MKKIIDFRGFAIGGAFLLVISGLGSWLFEMPFWQALLIGLASMVVLGVIAAFEGDQRQDSKGSGQQ